MVAACGGTSETGTPGAGSPTATSGASVEPGDSAGPGGSDGATGSEEPSVDPSLEPTDEPTEEPSGEATPSAGSLTCSDRTTPRGGPSTSEPLAASTLLLISS